MNNTIVDFGRDLQLFDLGRWGSPYRLNPGGGTATVINCVIWDCPRPITLSDSANKEVKDRGSHITIRYSNIDGGQDGVSISGTYSTLSWQEGNMDIDPQFIAPDKRDYHLRSEAGRREPDSETWCRDRLTSPCVDAGDPNSDWTGELWSHGKRINLGAFGGTSQASMSPSMIGTPADLNNDGIVDAKDLHAFTYQWLKVEMLLSEDINRDGTINLPDFALLSSD